MKSEETGDWWYEASGEAEEFSILFSAAGATTMG